MAFFGDRAAVCRADPRGAVRGVCGGERAGTALGCAVHAYLSRFSVFRGTQKLGTFTTTTANTRFASARSGAFPQAGGEAAALLSLEPGSYTVMVDLHDFEQGEVLGEVYFPQ